MSTESEARAAIAELDGYSLNGSRIHVEVCFSDCVILTYNSTYLPG